MLQARSCSSNGRRPPGNRRSRAHAELRTPSRTGRAQTAARARPHQAGTDSRARQATPDARGQLLINFELPRPEYRHGNALAATSCRPVSAQWAAPRVSHFKLRRAQWATSAFARMMMRLHRDMASDRLPVMTPTPGRLRLRVGLGLRGHTVTARLGRSVWARPRGHTARLP